MESSVQENKKNICNERNVQGKGISKEISAFYSL